MSELTLHSTKDLIGELVSRFDHVVFSGVKVLDTARTNSLNVRKFYGNHIVCAGLCTQLTGLINEDYEEKLTLATGNENELS